MANSKIRRKGSDVAPKLGYDWGVARRYRIGGKRRKRLDRWQEE